MPAANSACNPRLRSVVTVTPPSSHRRGEVNARTGGNAETLELRLAGENWATVERTSGSDTAKVVRYWAMEPVSGDFRPMRQAPPIRKSLVTLNAGHSTGPIQLTRISGRVHAAHTRARGAAKVRVICSRCGYGTERTATDHADRRLRAPRRPSWWCPDRYLLLSAWLPPCSHPEGVFIVE